MVLIVWTRDAQTGKTALSYLPQKPCPDSATGVPRKACPIGTKQAANSRGVWIVTSEIVLNACAQTALDVWGHVCCPVLTIANRKQLASEKIHMGIHCAWFHPATELDVTAKGLPYALDQKNDPELSKALVLAV